MFQGRLFHLVASRELSLGHRLNDNPAVRIALYKFQILLETERKQANIIIVEMHMSMGPLGTIRKVNLGKGPSPPTVRTTSSMACKVLALSD